MPELGDVAAGVRSPAETDPLPVGAAVDVGSTSIHLLVAGIDGHRLEPLADESRFLRLGDRIAETGHLGLAARQQLLGTLVGYRAKAQAMGAGSVVFVGTEAMRRAADAPVVVHEAERAGIGIHVLDHEEEGILMLLGVTGGVPVRKELVMVDIGGGSSEFVIVGPTRPPVASGVRLGAARMTADLATDDPPTPHDVHRLLVEARARVAEAPEASSREWVAVGGTASNLLKVVPGAVIDRRLTHDQVVDALDRLSSMLATDAARRYRINPLRARILPAGAAIVLAILERYRLDGLRVAEQGVREGAILAAARGGRDWRDRLTRLAQGWGRASSKRDG